MIADTFNDPDDPRFEAAIEWLMGDPKEISTEWIAGLFAVFPDAERKRLTIHAAEMLEAAVTIMAEQDADKDTRYVRKKECRRMIDAVIDRLSYRQGFCFEIAIRAMCDAIPSDQPK